MSSGERDSCFACGSNENFVLQDDEASFCGACGDIWAPGGEIEDGQKRLQRDFDREIQ